jgi:hypothetical protein
MEAAAIVAIALSNGQGEPPDWQDFVGIVLLLLIVRPSHCTTHSSIRLEKLMRFISELGHWFL